MPCREARFVDCQEALHRWLAGDGVRPIARATVLDRKTVRRFVTVALRLGLKPGDPWPTVVYFSRPGCGFAILFLT